MITLIDGLFYEVETNHMGDVKRKIVGFNFETSSEGNFFKELANGLNTQEILDKFSTLMPMKLFRVKSEIGIDDDYVEEVTLTDIKPRGGAGNYDFYIIEPNGTESVMVQSPYMIFSKEQLFLLNKIPLVVKVNILEKKLDELNIENKFASNLFKNINIAIEEKTDDN